MHAIIFIGKTAYIHVFNSKGPPDDCTRLLYFIDHFNTDVIKYYT